MNKLLNLLGTVKLQWELYVTTTIGMDSSLMHALHCDNQT